MSAVWGHDGSNWVGFDPPRTVAGLLRPQLAGLAGLIALAVRTEMALDLDPRGSDETVAALVQGGQLVARHHRPVEFPGPGFELIARPPVPGLLSDRPACPPLLRDGVRATLARTTMCRVWLENERAVVEAGLGIRGLADFDDMDVVLHLDAGATVPSLRLRHPQASRHERLVLMREANRRLDRALATVDPRRRRRDLPVIDDLPFEALAPRLFAVYAAVATEAPGRDHTNFRLRPRPAGELWRRLATVWRRRAPSAPGPVSLDERDRSARETRDQGNEGRRR